MKLTLIYCEYSGTIRQMPQNYMIAYQANAGTNYAYWVCTPDIAADVELSVKVFKALFDFDIRHGSAENLLKKMGF